MTVADDLENGGGSSGAGAAAMENCGADWLGDPAKLTHPIKAVRDKYELLPAFLKVRS